MARSTCRRCDSGPHRPPAWFTLTTLAVLTLSAGPMNAQAPVADATQRLHEAAEAEANGAFDLALDRLYDILLREPGSPAALPARYQLAQLLVLSGDLPQAALQYQALRDALPLGDQRRSRVFELATLVARSLRVRAGESRYAPAEVVSLEGLREFERPSAMWVETSGALLVVDRDARQVYRTTAGRAASIPNLDEPAAVTLRPDGALAVAVKDGVRLTAQGARIVFTGTWNGRRREVRDVRAMASSSTGHLFVIDDDFDGVLRCAAETHRCEPFGPPGKARALKVGAADLVHVLDDNGRTVRVINA